MLPDQYSCHVLKLSFIWESCQAGDASLNTVNLEERTGAPGRGLDGNYYNNSMIICYKQCVEIISSINAVM